MNNKLIAMGLGAAALSLAIPSVARAANCTTSANGFKYCVDDGGYDYDFYFSDKDRYEDVDVTMMFDEGRREVWFSFIVYRCGSSCTFTALDSFNSPHMPMITMDETPTDDDMVYAPFTATFHMGQGDDRITGQTHVIHADGSTINVNYFPGKALGQKGQDVIRYMAIADGGNGRDYIKGTRYADYLKGGDGGDEIHGGGGDDIIMGQGGDDHLYGDDGDDAIDGGRSGTCTNISCNDQVNSCWGGNGSDTFQWCEVKHQS